MLRLGCLLAITGIAGCGASPSVSSGFSTGGFAVATGATFGVASSAATFGDGSNGGEFGDGGFFPTGTTGGTGPVQYCGIPDGGTPIPCSVYDEDGGGTGYRPDGGESVDAG